MSQILDKVNHYYTAKIEQHGATPQGVDWNGEESQNLRFQVLAELFNGQKNPSILDYGCGFGSMYDFLKNQNFPHQFFGFDLSEKMIEAAIEKHGINADCQWATNLPNQKFDFVVASGIFNVRLDTTPDEWLRYIETTIDHFDQLATRGFAFNVLTKYSDAEYMRDYLYYADPLHLFDICKKKYSRNVALLHDYNLYEFTILVRKTDLA